MQNTEGYLNSNPPHHNPPFHLHNCLNCRLFNIRMRIIYTFIRSFKRGESLLFFHLNLENSIIKLIISFNVVLFSCWTFFANQSDKSKSVSEIPMCGAVHNDGINPLTGAFIFNQFKSAKATPSVFLTDDAKAYSMPLLSQTPKGEVLLSWTEKDEQGMTSFCLAFSQDNGKTFSEKKVIYAGNGIGNSRLMRAKVLAKKDGSLVAVFTNRADAPAAATAGTQQGGGGSKGRGGRSSDLVYCVSKDGGTNANKETASLFAFIANHQSNQMIDDLLFYPLTGIGFN